MASDSLTVMPVHWGIHLSPTVVMPVKTGIQFLGSEGWIPAYAGMTEVLERMEHELEVKRRK